jgi:3-carboxy-cis,cis-muconate cycloisomerase
MPHNNTPMRSEQTLAAARRAGAELVALQLALVQEHERGTHGWQVEWLSLSPLLALAAGALHHTLILLQELEVDAARMRANLLAPPAGAFAEAAVGALSEHLPRPEAQVRVASCAARARAEGRTLVQVLEAELGPHHAIDWAWLAQPENHLGQALAWVDQSVSALRAASAAIAG